MHGRIRLRLFCLTRATLPVTAGCDPGNPGDPGRIPLAHSYFVQVVYSSSVAMVGQQSLSAGLDSRFKL